MIFTSVSYIGDHILLWPIASWFYKNHNRKIDWVCTKNYYMYHVIKPFLEMQEFTNSVTLVNVGTDAHDISCWAFNPEKFGISGSYFNFGFTGPLLSNTITEKLASVHELGIDKEFIPKLDLDHEDIKSIKDEEIKDKVTMKVQHADSRWNLWKSHMPSDVFELPTSNSYIKNVYLGLKAKERYLGASSFAVVMDFFNVPCNIFCQPGVEPNTIYRNVNIHKYIQG